MEFSIKRGSAPQQKTPCMVVPVHSGKALSGIALELDKKMRGAIAKLLKRGDISGKIGSTLLLPEVSGIAADRVLLVGAGKSTGISAAEFRKLAVGAARALKQHKIKSALSTLTTVVCSDHDGVGWNVNEQVRQFSSVAYTFTEHKSKSSASPLARLGILVADDQLADARPALVEAKALADGIKLARDLGNRPGNVCTPSHLAETAIELGERFDALNVTVLEEDEMEALGMGSLLSVSRGSRQPAKLITMEYRGSNAGDKPVVLVGKGVTFDSGGISIKPGAGMDEMKYDMCGAASVLGTVSALCAMNAPVNVVGVVPATENLPDGDASKPGDIVTSMSGQTIEVLNTDAEGRLILCDALTYSAKFNPDVVVDIATLTGACVIALGAHATGLMANNDELADDLLAAGVASGDRAWRLPLWDEYQRQIDSPFADIANVGGRQAGTITAACFLSRFTKAYRWAHLDIAGTAWTSGSNKSATGRPVALLTEFIRSRSSAAADDAG